VATAEFKQTLWFMEQDSAALVTLSVCIDRVINVRPLKIPLEARVKRFILGICVLVFMLAASGFSQTTTSDWKGFYIGANVGGAFGGSNARTSTVTDPSGYFADSSVPAVNAVGDQHIDLNGFTGGGQIGYNGTVGKTFLVGLEADFGSLNLGESTSGTAEYPCCAGTFFTVNQRVSTSWLFTARPRVGITFGKALVYGTAGLAVTNIRHQELFTDTFANALEFGGNKENRTGWTAGGGVEFKLASHWSAKGEYLYTGFGKVSSTSTNLTADVAPGSFPTNVFTHSADFHANIVRAGLNYRF
jgi:outer membrane immunogenic protein